MRKLLFIIVIFFINGCDIDIMFGTSKSERSSPHLKCQLVKLGMSVADTDTIMDGIGRDKVTYESGSKVGAGYITYWNRSTDIKFLTTEPMRIVIPHGEICVVKYNVKQIITNINSTFVDESEYQRILQKAQ